MFRYSPTASSSTDYILHSGDNYCPCCCHKRDAESDVAYVRSTDNNPVESSLPLLVLYSESCFIPSCGYWPHELHDRYIKKRIKPIDQIRIKPIVHRKQFMQLSTFKNIRF